MDPGYDHTSRVVPLPQQYGYWIRTRREIGMSGNNTATLMTVRSIESSNYYCLTFWYHMWGSNSAQFALLLNQYQSQNGGAILWLKTTPQSNNWVKESVTVRSTIPYYLMFRATLQPSDGRHEDSIGLDDITWSDGKCPNQPLCDFEVSRSQLFIINQNYQAKFSLFRQIFVVGYQLTCHGNEQYPHNQQISHLSQE